MSDLKLRRFLEQNQRLKEQLDMNRIPVSEASQSLIKFVTSTKDSLLPSLWGNAASDPFSKQSTGCCTIF
ncbi:G-protein gamma-like domain-containing protein [Lobosporangium transversale]|uniref:Guanine nucleotide-binding protein subunit gamma n=1 Tax=Lobosporangium transversale TaxID=64571 RepID=A0A1Y2G6U0_9FUNG|nr:G-protein gamma-like domain-containing protein [Lobosporangium transversale]ORY99492.1 G-protein gamma-like domain-containing protein [Lobosporangium transversale]|eukprot:XP_021875818.1 G-protein gamma-like domain-containing protein [Lobosporangium transversale]